MQPGNQGAIIGNRAIGKSIEQSRLEAFGRCLHDMDIVTAGTNQPLAPFVPALFFLPLLTNPVRISDSAERMHALVRPHAKHKAHADHSALG